VPTRFGQGQKTVPIGVSEIGEPSGKVVSERLAHATPGFTMATYQHVLPGMQAEAARRTPWAEVNREP